MRKDFGKEAAVFPLPVFIIATYDGNGRADAMNAAWGGRKASGRPADRMAGRTAKGTVCGPAMGKRTGMC